MFFSKHPSEALNELELHKAALIYHKKKHTLPPMQQVQQVPPQPPPESTPQEADVSSNLSISIGNIFQDQTNCLPVMYLSEHHLDRLRKMRAQRLNEVSTPTTEKERSRENTRLESNKRVGKSEPVVEAQPLTVDIVTHKTPLPFLNDRKFLRKNLQNPVSSISPNTSSIKTSNEEIEEKVRAHVKSVNEVSTEIDPTLPATINDSNWPLLPPRNAFPVGSTRLSGATLFDCSDDETRRRRK